jgi:hypothetical protein
MIPGSQRQALTARLSLLSIEPAWGARMMWGYVATYFPTKET